MQINNSLLVYSLSSVGLLAILYKLVKYFQTKSLKKSYFRDKTVLITGKN